MNASQRFVVERIVSYQISFVTEYIIHKIEQQDVWRAHTDMIPTNGNETQILNYFLRLCYRHFYSNNNRLDAVKSTWQYSPNQRDVFLVEKTMGVTHVTQHARSSQLFTHLTKIDVCIFWRSTRSFSHNLVKNSIKQNSYEQ